MNVYSRIAYDKDKESGYNCGLFNHTKTCTRRDDDKSYLYWTWTTAHFKDLTANYFMYLALWFVPPLLAGHTRITGFS